MFLPISQWVAWVDPLKFTFWIYQASYIFIFQIWYMAALFIHIILSLSRWSCIFTSLPCWFIFLCVEKNRVIFGSRWSFFSSISLSLFMFGIEGSLREPARRARRKEAWSMKSISDCGFKSSMLDTGYSMLDKDLPFTTDTWNQTTDYWILLLSS